MRGQSMHCTVATSMNPTPQKTTPRKHAYPRRRPPSSSSSSWQRHPRGPPHPKGPLRGWSRWRRAAAVGRAPPPWPVWFLVGWGLERGRRGRVGADRCVHRWVGTVDRRLIGRRPPPPRSTMPNDSVPARRARRRHRRRRRRPDGSYRPCSAPSWFELVERSGRLGLACVPVFKYIRGFD